VNMQPTIKASEFDGDLSEFLKQYGYQAHLTPKLDALHQVQFTQELVNEIVLWKVNRFVELNEGLLRKIENVRELSPGEHRNSESLIESLLQVPGVDLPMASTLLRFRNPAVFQIIDRHAYRAIFGVKYPFYPSTSPKKKIGGYFDYIDELIELCDRKALKFETVDRALYQFDKQENGHLKGH
jgi:hypothetical protein